MCADICCSGRQQPMGWDVATPWTSAKPLRPAAAAFRSIHMGATCGSCPVVRRNTAILPMQAGRTIMSYRRLFLLALLLAVLGAVRPTHPVSAGDEWQPISQEELKMASEPKAPWAPAVYLYRQVDRDDNTHTPHEYNYARIKILTEEGRKYADVEIPFFKEEGDIHGIKARTIQHETKLGYCSSLELAGRSDGGNRRTEG